MIRSAVIVLLLMLSASPAAAQQEQIVLQSSCAVVNGQVMITPTGRDTPAPLLSRWEEQSGTLCDRRRAPPVCRTLNVYRFDISCGGRRVPWIIVYAAAFKNNPDIRFDGARMLFNVAGQWQAYPAGFAPLGGSQRIERMSSPQTTSGAIQRPLARAPVQPIKREHQSGFVYGSPCLLIMLGLAIAGILAWMGHPTDGSRRIGAMTAASLGILFSFIGWIDELPLFFVLLPSLYLLVRNGMAIVRGAHYLFVAHPAQATILPAVRQGVPLDRCGLAAALQPVRAMFTSPPAAWKMRNQTARAQALQQKLDADAALA